MGQCGSDWRPRARSGARGSCPIHLRDVLDSGVADGPARSRSDRLGRYLSLATEKALPLARTADDRSTLAVQFGVAPMVSKGGKVLGYGTGLPEKTDRVTDLSAEIATPETADRYRAIYSHLSAPTHGEIATLFEESLRQQTQRGTENVLTVARADPESYATAAGRATQALLTAYARLVVARRPSPFVRPPLLHRPRPVEVDLHTSHSMPSVRQHRVRPCRIGTPRGP